MATMVKALIAVMAMATIFQLAVGTNYTVGAPGGSWDLKTNYANWVSSITFVPGDVLIFSYTSAHDVLEVSQSDYASCTNSNPISSDSSGNTVVSLTAAGTRYFICGIGNHCASGMKVQIVVTSKNSSPATPPPAATTTPPPPPPSTPTAGSPPPSQPNAPPAVDGPAATPPPNDSAAGVAGLGVREKVAFAFGLGAMMLVAF